MFSLKGKELGFYKKGKGGYIFRGEKNGASTNWMKEQNDPNK